ncbi:MAG: porin family protein [Hyphomicrobiales bacterium]|nr:porin family protein [Hyphomicrobiales bacterium]
MKYGLALVVFIISTISAFAADLPAKTYTKGPVMAAHVYNWTGFYGGLNIGGGWANTEVNYRASSFGYSGVPGAAFLDAGTSGQLRTSGFTGGGQLGYNYQTGSAVWGFEGDLNYTGFRGTRFIPLNFAPIGVNLTDNFTQRMKSNWLATLRGRLGFTTGPVLLYATGGLALANVGYSDFGYFPFLPSTNSASASGVRAGWTVGGGAEWMIAPRWSIKAEYLYVDLGNTRYTSTN